MISCLSNIWKLELREYFNWKWSYWSFTVHTVDWCARVRLQIHRLWFDILLGFLWSEKWNDVWMSGEPTAVWTLWIDFVAHYSLYLNLFRRMHKLVFIFDIVPVYDINSSMTANEILTFFRQIRFSHVPSRQRSTSFRRITHHGDDKQTL